MDGGLQLQWHPASSIRQAPRNENKARGLGGEFLTAAQRRLLPLLSEARTPSSSKVCESGPRRGGGSIFYFHPSQVPRSVLGGHQALHTPQLQQFIV